MAEFDFDADDISGFETNIRRLLNRAYIRNSISNEERAGLDRLIDRAIAQWVDADEKAMRARAVRNLSVGQAVTYKGDPGIVTAIGGTMVTVTRFMAGDDGEALASTERCSPRGVRVMSTRTDLETWKSSMRAAGYSEWPRWSPDRKGL